MSLGNNSTPSPNLTQYNGLLFIANNKNKFLNISKDSRVTLKEENPSNTSELINVLKPVFENYKKNEGTENAELIETFKENLKTYLRRANPKKSEKVDDLVAKNFPFPRPDLGKILNTNEPLTPHEKFVLRTELEKLMKQNALYKLTRKFCQTLYFIASAEKLAFHLSDNAIEELPIANSTSVLNIYTLSIGKDVNGASYAAFLNIYKQFDQFQRIQHDPAKESEKDFKEKKIAALEKIFHSCETMVAKYPHAKPVVCQVIAFCWHYVAYAELHKYLTPCKKEALNIQNTYGANNVPEHLSKFFNLVYDWSCQTQKDFQNPKKRRYNCETDFNTYDAGIADYSKYRDNYSKIYQQMHNMAQRLGMEIKNLDEEMPGCGEPVDFLVPMERFFHLLQRVKNPTPVDLPPAVLENDIKKDQETNTKEVTAEDDSPKIKKKIKTKTRKKVEKTEANEENQGVAEGKSEAADFIICASNQTSPYTPNVVAWTQNKDTYNIFVNNKGKKYDYLLDKNKKTIKKGSEALANQIHLEHSMPMVFDCFIEKYGITETSPDGLIKYSLIVEGPSVLTAKGMETYIYEVIKNQQGEIFHRTALKKNKSTEIVAEYLKNSEYELDFPPLSQPDVSQHVDPKLYKIQMQDGSCVKKVGENTIVCALGDMNFTIIIPQGVMNPKN